MSSSACAFDDPALAHSVEKQMRDLEETVYEPVP